MTGLDLTTDVLVVGGGPAATWAALKAAQAGADVVLADKGYCGTSGATASGGTGVWYVPPEPAAREAALASREKLGGYLADRRWKERVLDQTYAGMNELAAAGRYPFPAGPDGKPLRKGLQGPEYMRRMRIRVQRAGGAHPRPQPGHRAAHRLLRGGRRGQRPPAPGRRAVPRTGRGGRPRDQWLRVPQRRAGLQRQHRGRCAAGRRDGRRAVRDGVLQRLRHRP
jgi:succinate dehydrogenase/fumarate reductase flavoprotein subunit